LLRAIAAAERKNDRIDADKIADCLRCDLLRDPGPDAALPEPGAEADGADEEPHFGAC